MLYLELIYEGPAVPRRNSKEGHELHILTPASVEYHGTDPGQFPRPLSSATANGLVFPS